MIAREKSSPSIRIYFGARRDNLSDKRKVYTEPEQAFFEDYSLPGARLYEKNRQVCLITRRGK